MRRTAIGSAPTACMTPNSRVRSRTLAVIVEASPITPTTPKGRATPQQDQDDGTQVTLGDGLAAADRRRGLHLDSRIRERSVDGIGDRLAGLLVVAGGGDAQLVHPRRLPHGLGEPLRRGVHAAAVPPFFDDTDDAPGGRCSTDEQLHGVAGVEVGDGVVAGDLVEHDRPSLTRVQPVAFQQLGSGQHGRAGRDRSHRDAAVSLVGIGAGDGKLSWPGHAGLGDVQGLDPADVRHPLHHGDDLAHWGWAAQLHVDVPDALLSLLLGDRLGTGAQGHSGHEHHAGTGQQADREQESGGTPDGVAQRQQQATVEAANVAQPGQEPGRRARVGADTVVVDRRPHGGAAGLDQRRQRQQRWQDQAGDDDHHIGPPRRREAGGLDAEEPEERPNRDAPEQDGGGQREQGNPNFTGRGELLTALRGLLQARQTGAVVQASAVHGLGWGSARPSSHRVRPPVRHGHQPQRRSLASGSSCAVCAAAADLPPVRAPGRVEVGPRADAPTNVTKSFVIPTCLLTLRVSGCVAWLRGRWRFLRRCDG
jgi:hypothetical protein